MLSFVGLEDRLLWGPEQCSLPRNRVAEARTLIVVYLSVLYEFLAATGIKNEASTYRLHVLFGLCIV